MHHLLTKYPKSGYVIGGDKNKLQLQPLLDALPKCRQIVNKCTYKAKIQFTLQRLCSATTRPKVCPATTTLRWRSRWPVPAPPSGIKVFGSWLQSVQWQEHLTPNQTQTSSQ